MKYIEMKVKGATIKVHPDKVEEMKQKGWKQAPAKGDK